MPAIPLALFAVHHGFSLFGFGVARDLIRMAADTGDTVALDVLTAARSSGPVQSSCGASVLADCGWADLERAKYVFVCSSRGDAPVKWDDALLSGLRHCHRHGGWVIGLGTGVEALARSGLLNGRRASAHPAQLPALQVAFPKAEFALDSFAFDERIATSVGGDAVTDMMLELLSRCFDPGIAENVRREIMLKPVRSETMLVSVGLRRSADGLDPRLVRFVQFVERTLADPKPLEDACSAVGVSTRTLTRLTTRAFGCSPGVLSLRIRLSCAADLLRTSAMGLKDVAEACGFGSATYFSEAFHRHQGVRPGRYRRRGGSDAAL